MGVGNIIIDRADRAQGIDGFDRSDTDIFKRNDAGTVIVRDRYDEIVAVRALRSDRAVCDLQRVISREISNDILTVAGSELYDVIVLISVDGIVTRSTSNGRMPKSTGNNIFTIATIK